jgi:ribosomal protein S18 acetylase RimI-like enzyme
MTAARSLLVMSLTIRALERRDYYAWLPLWQGYLDFYEASVTDEVTAATWRRIVDPHGPINGLGAFAEETLVGIVHYLFHPVTWSVSDRCYLEDLFVDPGARRTGAGRALIEAVYRAADKAGASQVYWLTAHDNATARRLYDEVARLTPFVKYQR